MTDSAATTGPTRRRRLIALSVSIGLVVGVVIAVESLSSAQVAFWFGETVEHCPNSELSCPSQKPGVFFLVLVPAVLLTMYLEGSDE